MDAMDQSGAEETKNDRENVPTPKNLNSNLLPIHINYIVENRILHVIAHCSNGEWQVTYGATIREQKILEIELTDTFEKIHNKLQAGEGMQRETQQEGFFWEDFRKVFSFYFRNNFEIDERKIIKFLMFF